ncbi:hypothetical protein TWF281_008967 [Arthrobotrys megalospora]
MTSITTLSKIPEIIFIILEYLPRPAVLSLLQTCKSLYPICYAHLWSTISLVERDPNRSSHDDRWADKLQSLANLIKTKGVDALGFRHTRVLELGPAVLAVECDPGQIGSQRPRYSEKGAEFILLLCDIINGNKLNLQETRIELYRNIRGASVYIKGRPRELIHSLKRYSETKSSKDLSIHLKTDVVQDIHILYNVKLITDLTLFVNSVLGYREGHHDENAVTCWSEAPLGSNIIELATLLAGLRNLKRFHWAGHRSTYSLSKMSDIVNHLAKLQAVFDKIDSLRELVLDIPFFHPSFFLTPPGRLRTLRIQYAATNEWWEKFSKCAMPSVENLEVYGSDDIYGPAEDIFDIGRHHYNPLGDVAICNLKRLNVSGYLLRVPPDLEDCLRRRNRGLSSDSLKRIAQHKADVAIPEYEQILRDQSYRFAEALSTKYSSKLINEPEKDHRQDYARDFSKSLIGFREIAGVSTSHGHPWETKRPTEPGSRWGPGPAQELAVTVRKKLSKALNNCVHHVETIYAERLMEGCSDISEEDFRRECLQLFTESSAFYETSGWQESRKRARRLGNFCGEEMRLRLGRSDPVVRDRFKEIFSKEEPDPSELLVELATEVLEGFKDPIWNPKAT